MKFFLFYPLPFFILLVILGVLTHIPTLPKLPINFYEIDKFEHFFAYLFLAFLLFRWMKKINQQKNYLLFFLALSFYAGTDEFFQLFVPGRTASVFDFLADFLALLTIFLIYKRNLKNENYSS